MDGSDHIRQLLSFPTRRSSDLAGDAALVIDQRQVQHRVLLKKVQVYGRIRINRRRDRFLKLGAGFFTKQFGDGVIQIGDRKSTRLNSSHLVISYAVFCLKKENY